MQFDISKTHHLLRIGQSNWLNSMIRMKSILISVAVCVSRMNNWINVVGAIFIESIFYIRHNNENKIVDNIGFLRLFLREFKVLCRPNTNPNGTCVVASMLSRNKMISQETSCRTALSFCEYKCFFLQMYPQLIPVSSSSCSWVLVLMW